MHLERTSFAVLLIVVSILVAAPAAQATTRHHRTLVHHRPVCKRRHVARRVRHHHKRVWRCEPIHHRRHRHDRHARRTSPSTPVSSTPGLPATPTDPVLGFGGAPYGGCSATPEPGMTLERVIVYWDTPVDLFAQCAANAHQAGLRLLVSIQYDANWPMSRIETRFQQALAVYVPDQPYAISIGNEQELQAAASPASYHRVWDAVEPIVAAADPQAIRVAGEISPWGLGWFEQAAALGLPGAQAFAAHPYPDSQSPWAADPTPFVQLAHQYGVPAWATEGMCGPGAWARYGCSPRSLFARDGFALAIEWYAPTV